MMQASASSLQCKCFMVENEIYCYTFSPRDSVIDASTSVFKGLFQQQQRRRDRNQSGRNRNRSRSRNRSHSSSESQKRLRPSKDEKSKALAESYRPNCSRKFRMCPFSFDSAYESVVYKALNA